MSTPPSSSAPAPVVYFIYGGGWNRGERSDYQFVGRALAARGFVTVIADYRLVPEVRYPEFLEDNANGLRWVQDNIAQYGGDPNRVFSAGHSAGAYNAVMLALDPSFLREYGVTLSILGVAALSGPYDFYPFEYGEVRDAFGDAPNPQGTQPINLVTSNTPPMYLATGTTDPIVRMQNTERFAQKLKDSGIWVTTKYYNGFGHMEPVIAMGSMWRWRMPVLDDMVSFFQMFGAFPERRALCGRSAGAARAIAGIDCADGPDHPADGCHVPADPEIVRRWRIALAWSDEQSFAIFRRQPPCSGRDRQSHHPAATGVDGYSRTAARHGFA
ncbi:alpha/beta hydrolase [Devosia sp. A8/3-2]|nr:alpha/beta hydrolase [Devosia sp. A8/3-2]